MLKKQKPFVYLYQGVILRPNLKLTEQWRKQLPSNPALFTKSCYVLVQMGRVCRTGRDTNRSI